MKNLITCGIFALALGLSAPQLAHAQGTRYLSSLGLTSNGSSSVGSDSWLAADFGTGTNADGYLLDSVQLALGDASGSPSGFTAMIYDNGNIPAGGSLGRSLGTLTGSLDPVTAGIYTFSPASNLTLLPSTPYFIVLTAGTAVADGAYKWSYSSIFAPTSSGGWTGDGYFLSSSAGLFWTQLAGDHAQFAIYATEVPEPTTLGLLTLGGFFLAWHRRKPLAV